MEIDRVQLGPQTIKELYVTKEQMEERRTLKLKSSVVTESPDPIQQLDRFDREVYEQNPDVDLRLKLVITDLTPPKVGETIDDTPVLGADGVYYIHQKPSHFNENSIGTDFFDQPLTFFQDLADKYLESPTLLMGTNYFLNGIGKFASDALHFFGKSEGDNHKTLVEQIKYAAKELAEKSKANPNVSLKDITQKLSIGDVEFSVDEMVKTINALHEIERPLNYWGGNLCLDQFISFGMSVSQVKRYTVENLNEAQGKLVTDTYQKRVDHAIKVGDSYERTLEEIYAQAGMSITDFKGNRFAVLNAKSKGTVKEASYKLFSSLDTSSDRAYKASFAKAMKTFDGYMKLLSERWYPTQSYYQTANNAFFSMQINSDGAKRTKPFSVHA